ncbi:MAG: hypothetical protein RMJ53_09460, partial [Chitinophagales bacterium]|nr:hypothetical protein [Chitinophagales bacterium]
MFWGAVGYAAEVYKGKYLNSKPVKYVGQFLQSDQILGISNKPGKEAYLKYFDKTDTVFIDKNAFRVSNTNFYLHAQNLSDTSLFLGCSFTFGFFCKTDSTYPEIVCRQINSYCMNGGTNSFGLAQMQMLAEKYIPEFKPKRVIVQYSSWLPWRSKLYYLPISSALVPNPYYFKKNNEIYIAPPLFVTSFYDLNLPENRPYLFKYIYLSATRILPFYFHEIYQKIKVGLMLRLKLRPQSHNNLDELAQAGYTNIYRVVKNYGGMMYLVSIGNGMNTTCPDYFKNEKENFCF